jgi:hypothetical protein
MDQLLLISTFVSGILVGWILHRLHHEFTAKKKKKKDDYKW